MLYQIRGASLFIKQPLNRRQFMRFILLISSLSILVSCTAYQYNKEVCDSSRRTDVPNIEGTYVSYSEQVSHESYAYLEVETKIAKSERGVYKTESSNGTKDEFNTCSINGRYFMETPTYYENPQISPQEKVSGFMLSELLIDENSVESMAVLFDPKELDAKLPYSFTDNLLGCIDRKKIKPFSFFNFVPCANPIILKHLLIDNTNATPEHLLSVGQQQFATLIMHRKVNK